MHSPSTMDIEYTTASAEEESEPPCCEGSLGHVGEAGVHVLSSGNLQWSASIEAKDPEPARRLPGVLPWGSSEESRCRVSE